MIARGNVEAEELSELLADIVADGHRAREVIEGIRNMVRRTEATHAPIQIGEILQDLLRMVRADALAKNITITMEIDPNIGCVMGDRVQLLQVFLNLTLNAFEAMSVMRADTRRLVIRAHRSGSSEVFVSVRDSGPGFPGGLAEQLFEPFFSTKAEGTGMGLAIARSIVDGAWRLALGRRIARKAVPSSRSGCLPPKSATPTSCRSVPKRLSKYWDGSRVEAEGRMARSEEGASPQWAVTTERRSQLPFCLAPSSVAWIFGVGPRCSLGRDRCGYRHRARALANAKIHSNATPSSISTVS